MSQYKHDRFIKFYVQSSYRTKGEVVKDIKVYNDENLEIDLMFKGDLELSTWQEQNLGIFDILMQSHPTIIIEHYSSYLEGVDIDDCMTRKNLYWKSLRKKLIAEAGSQPEGLSKEVLTRIESNNPFTWILAVNCSKPILEGFRAFPDDRFPAGVYLLGSRMRMGIVNIKDLPETPDTLWLKMLGDRQSARRAFQSLQQLSTPNPAKSDIIAAAIKYCVYLKDLPIATLTPEDTEFMKTMEEIDTWYATEMSRAKLEGTLEGEQRGEQRQQRTIALNLLRKNIPLETIAETTGLTLEQLQELSEHNSIE
jgi:hypothetical protein